MEQEVENLTGEIKALKVELDKKTEAVEELFFFQRIIQPSESYQFSNIPILEYHSKKTQFMI